MYCSSCGKKINDTNKYCPYCGNLNKFSKEDSENQNNRIISNQDSNKDPNINQNNTIKLSEKLEKESQNINEDQNISYFLKHWRGDLSLAVIYWVNNVLLNMVLLVLITIIVKKIDFTDSPVLPAILIITIWLFILVLIPWILVGLWRSAENHVKKYNKFFWARLVQVLVVIGWIQSIALTINTAIPQIVEFSKIALNQDDLSDYKIKILNNGNELEISGGIKFGLTNEIKKYFIQYPNIKVIHLNSLGGRITEAQKLSEFFENKGITTYSSKGCYSACTDIFMSGEYRVINQNAKLGFHQPSFPGSTPTDLYNEIEKEKLFYRKRGVKNNFIEKAFSTPHQELWEPSYYELKQAGVIHKVVDGFNFSATDLQGLEAFSDIKKIESSFLSIPVYQTIKTYEPEAFKQIVEIIHSSVKSGDTRNNMNAKGRAIVQKLFLKYLPYASDELISDSLNLALTQTKMIYREDPIAAYDFAMGTLKNSNPSQYFSKELIGKELELMNDVIISGKSNPQIIPNEKDIEGILSKLLVPLMREFGENFSLIGKENLTDLEKATASKILIRMYEIISGFNYEERTKVFRFFVGQA